MIQLKNVSKIYRTKTIETVALNNINLEIAEGEFLSVMGPSGCGKSTMLNIVGCLDQPTAGTYEIDGVLVKDLSRNELASMVGTSPETVIRTLSDFKEEQLIEVKGSKITILKPSELENLRF